ncbi:hypothetical protein NQL31_006272 [Lotmaria passim]
MLRVVLQRFAVQRSTAEMLDAVPLDEVLRRMQSSSLTNPARSLESHFVLAAQCPNAQLSSSHSSRSSSAGGLLRNALSERLLAEVRRDLHTPHLSLDAGSLMLANCLRHRLSPLATQQIFALWLKFMQNGTDSRSSPASASSSALGSLSMLGLGRSGGSCGGGGGGGAQASQLLQFQSLVRVLEACLDAQDQQCPRTNRSGRAAACEARGFATAAAAATSPVCFTLDDWAGLVDTVEQFWPLFADHGASTVGLLVQFTALALELTACASDTPAAAEPGSRFANSLRRLSHLQTDRTLLQTRVFGLCEKAVKTLCALERVDEAADEGEMPPRRHGLWWHRPQELVRLSQARRRIAAYESGERRRGGTPSTSSAITGARDRFSSESDAAPPPSLIGSAARHNLGKPRALSGVAVRGTRVGTHPRSTTASSPSPSFTAAPHNASSAETRWMPRLSSSWWASSSAGAAATSTYAGGGGGASAGRAPASRNGTAAVRVGTQLGGYVTYHALQCTAAVISADSPDTGAKAERASQTQSSLDSCFKGGASAALSPASLSVALKDILEIFETVCSTASSSDASAHVTTFSWWVRDVILHRHGRRSLHDTDEMASLLGIAELCLDYPAGTQTVLAEVMKCLQRSAAFLWQAGDSTGASLFCATGSSKHDASALWPRACTIVGEALPLTTVRSEADRTLRELVSTTQRGLSTSETQGRIAQDNSANMQLFWRQRRYGVLILACLLLQRPNGFVSPALSSQLRQLMFGPPFVLGAEDPNEFASTVRALYIFTHPAMSSPNSHRSSVAQQNKEIVSFLLNQVTRLVSPVVSGEPNAEEKDASATLSRSLAELSTTERQLLRSALREVRTSFMEKPRTPIAPESTSHGELLGCDPATADSTGEASRFASPTDVGRGSEVGLNASKTDFTMSSVRPQLASTSALGASRKEPLDRAKASLLRDQQASEFDELVRHRELDAMSRHLRKRRSAL